jgi:competence protein ComGC
MRFLVVFLGAIVGAAQALEPLVASSSFQLFLQPTFSQLTLEAQTIAAQSISSTIAAVGGDLRDVYVVIQDATFHGQGPRLGDSLQLPATTLTFVMFGSPSNDQHENYLNTMILNTFSSQNGQAQLIRELKTSRAHAFYKDLVHIQVWPITAFADNTSEQEGFFQKLTAIEICLVVVSILLLTGVAYIAIQSHRSTRREHERVLQLLSSHAAAVSSLQALEQDDAGSTTSKFAYLKSFMFDKKKSQGDLNTTPNKASTQDEEASTTDEEEPMSEEEPSNNGDEAMQVSSQESYQTAEHYPNSSSSYHSAQLLASSQEDELATSRSGVSSSSDGRISEFDYIPSPPSDEDSELYLLSQSSFSSSGYSGKYSSGMSSAHFSSSGWFQPNGIPTPSEDTFDVFQVDVDKYEEELLLDENESKTSRSVLFMEHWVKQIQVVPSEKSSVATPDSTATPECASVHSGSLEEVEETVDCYFVTHQAAPDHDKNAETCSPVEV